MLVFVPQRELAYQVNTVLHQILPEVKSSILVSGGDGIGPSKKPNVIIGTPTLMNTVFPIFHLSLQCSLSRKSLEKRILILSRKEIFPYRM